MQTGCITLISIFLFLALGLLPPQQVETFPGVELPPSATNIRFEDQAAFMLSSRWLRFDAPEDEAMVFLEALEIESVLEEGVNPFKDMDVPAWWDAAKQENVRGGIYQLRGDAVPKRDFFVMLSEFDTGMVRVYLLVVDDV